MAEAEKVEMQQPSLGQLAGQAYRETRDALLSDEGLAVSGMAVGAAGGLAVEVLVEGMPIKPTAAQQQAELRGGRASRDGTPAMVHASALEVGTVGGMTLLGLAGGVMIARMRAARHRQPES